MLDVARHFFGVDDVKRYMDLMALYKLNRLHLHLSDDQGWRIEIKSWPNLAIEGGKSEVGGGPGGYYTQQDYTALVDYGRERHITIVPEIDMPGHTNAALASYPDLNCDGIARQRYTGIEVGFSSLCVDKDITYKFIDDVVREIAALTPGAYFHIGGDEVKTLTAAQYVAFVERVQAIVQAHGKETIGWDEIAPAHLLPTTIVQHWRPDGAPSQAVAKGARVVMSVANRAYLDMQYDAGEPDRAPLGGVHRRARTRISGTRRRSQKRSRNPHCSASRRHCGPRRPPTCGTWNGWRFRGSRRSPRSRGRKGSVSGWSSPAVSARRHRAGPRSGSTSTGRRRCPGRLQHPFDDVGCRARGILALNPARSRLATALRPRAAPAMPPPPRDRPSRPAIPVTTALTLRPAIAIERCIVCERQQGAVAQRVCVRANAPRSGDTTVAET